MIEESGNRPQQVEDKLRERGFIEKGRHSTIFGVPLGELSTEALLGVCGKLLERQKTARNEQVEKDNFIGCALRKIAEAGR